MGDTSVEYYLIRLAGFCDSGSHLPPTLASPHEVASAVLTAAGGCVVGHHRSLLLQAELDGHSALPKILDLLVKRKGYGIDAMRIKMGVLKVIMTYLDSPDLLDTIGVKFKA